MISELSMGISPSYLAYQFFGYVFCNTPRRHFDVSQALDRREPPSRFAVVPISIHWTGRHSSPSRESLASRPGDHGTPENGKSVHPPLCCKVDVRNDPSQLWLRLKQG